MLVTCEQIGKADAAACDEQAVWARSGAWPPRAQTGKGENLTPVTADHPAGTLRHPKTQL
jgi:hypothetical protein